MKSANNFEEQVKGLISKAREAVLTKQSKFDSYHHETRAFWMQKLVGYALNNNLDINAEDFPFADYVGEYGIIYCDSRKNSEMLNDLIFKLTW